MKLLVLGGPKFLGRALANAALPRGHELTFFNRGRTNAALYPEAERLVGDRDGDAEIVWVPDEFLVEHGVGEWMELPLWLVDPAMSAADEAVIGRALAAGLRFRPLADTIRGTLDEEQATDAAGLSAEREAELLAAWHAR